MSLIEQRIWPWNRQIHGGGSMVMMVMRSIDDPRMLLRMLRLQVYLFLFPPHCSYFSNDSPIYRSSRSFVSTVYKPIRVTARTSEFPCTVVAGTRIPGIIGTRHNEREYRSFKSAGESSLGNFTLPDLSLDKSCTRCARHSLITIPWHLEGTR